MNNEYIFIDDVEEYQDICKQYLEALKKEVVE